MLCRLHEKRFGPDAPLPPSQGFSVREIAQDIEDELLTQDIWETEEGYSPETPLNIRAIQVFHRFEEAGWFRLEKFGVEMIGATKEAIDKAVEQLPLDYRELIQLRHFAELSYEEIAGVLEKLSDC